MLYRKPEQLCNDPSEPLQGVGLLPSSGGFQSESDVIFALLCLSCLLTQDDRNYTGKRSNSYAGFHLERKKISPKHKSHLKVFLFY